MTTFKEINYVLRSYIHCRDSIIHLCIDLFVANEYLMNGQEEKLNGTKINPISKETSDYI
jgi:hypothetical protein